MNPELIGFGVLKYNSAMHSIKFKLLLFKRIICWIGFRGSIGVLSCKFGARGLFVAELIGAAIFRRRIQCQVCQNVDFRKCTE